MFVNISYLSESMLEYIDAPMPYITGVPRHLWDSAKRQAVAEDVVVFDLDRNETTCREKLPDLPAKTSDSLYSTLLSIMKERKEVMEIYKNSARRERKVLDGVRSS